MPKKLPADPSSRPPEAALQAPPLRKNSNIADLCRWLSTRPTAALGQAASALPAIPPANTRAGSHAAGWRIRRSQPEAFDEANSPSRS